MAEITYKEIQLNEIDKIKEINPTQFIGRAWRNVKGKRELVDINYLDEDWPNGYDYHLKNACKTLNNSGCVLGAFSHPNLLVGFITINREFFGRNFNYVLLDQLFISLEHRNKGIGKRLFHLASQKARAWKADKLYICAGSAEETIAFYYAIGCQDALEINKEFYDSDPRDMQLEYKLRD